MSDEPLDEVAVSAMIEGLSVAEWRSIEVGGRRLPVNAGIVVRDGQPVWFAVVYTLSDEAATALQMAVEEGVADAVSKGMKLDERLYVRGESLASLAEALEAAVSLIDFADDAPMIEPSTREATTG